jgi:hypothetical protein
MRSGLHSTSSYYLRSTKFLHAKFRLGVCRPAHIGAKYRQGGGRYSKSSRCSGHHLRDDWHANHWKSPFGVSTSDHTRLACETYSRPSSPETRFLKYFPRRFATSSRTLALQNTWMNGSSTALRPCRFRLRAAAIAGHASPGNGFRTRHQMENSNDCYRLCQQAR